MSIVLLAYRNLPACRRLLFPLLHAGNKGNRRRLHAGNIEIGEFVVCVCAYRLQVFLFLLEHLLLRNREGNFLKKFYRCNVLVYWVSSQQSPAWLAFFYTWPWERFPLQFHTVLRGLHPDPALVNEDHVRLILLYRGSPANRILWMAWYFFFC